MRRVILLVTAACVATSAAAQGPGQVGLHQWSNTMAMGPAPSSSNSATSSTHWKEGMMIGGGVGVAAGVFLVAVSGRVCDVSCGGMETALFFGSIVVFSLVGGLIGSAVPKR